MNKIFFIYSIASLCLLANCYIVNETYTQERSYGIYSESISAQPQIGSDPSQYFVCKIAFR